jgi:hypothetical protein
MFVEKKIVLEINKKGRKTNGEKFIHYFLTKLVFSKEGM